MSTALPSRSVRGALALLLALLLALASSLSCRPPVSPTRCADAEARLAELRSVLNKKNALAYDAALAAAQLTVVEPPNRASVSGGNAQLSPRPDLGLAPQWRLRSPGGGVLEIYDDGARSLVVCWSCQLTFAQDANGDYVSVSFAPRTTLRDPGVTLCGCAPVSCDPVRGGMPPVHVAELVELDGRYVGERVIGWEKETVAEVYADGACPRRCYEGPPPP